MCECENYSESDLLWLKIKVCDVPKWKIEWIKFEIVKVMCCDINENCMVSSLTIQGSGKYYY